MSGQAASSNAFRRAVTVDWVTFIRSDARTRLPVSTIVRKVWRAVRFIGRSNNNSNLSNIYCNKYCFTKCTGLCDTPPDPGKSAFAGAPARHSNARTAHFGIREKPRVIGCALRTTHRHFGGDLFNVAVQTYQMLIDGAWVGAADGKTFDSINPTTARVWSQVPEATEDDVDKAVRAADRAFNDGPWTTMSPTERGHCLRRLADLLTENSEELGRIEAVDTGKLLQETRWQAKYIAEFFHFYAGCADKISGETLPIDKPDLFVFTNREPLGRGRLQSCRGTPSSFLSAVKIGPALAAGNTIVLKASEHASAAMLDFGRLIEEAGIPAGGRQHRDRPRRPVRQGR